MQILCGKNRQSVEVHVGLPWEHMLACSTSRSADLAAVCCTMSAHVSTRQYEIRQQRHTVKIWMLLLAAFGWLEPLAGLQQEVICVALD